MTVQCRALLQFKVVKCCSRVQQYSAELYSAAVQCRTVQCSSTVQCRSTVQMRSTVQCKEGQYYAVKGCAHPFNTVKCTTLRYIGDHPPDMANGPNQAVTSFDCIVKGINICGGFLDSLCLDSVFESSKYRNFPYSL